MLLKFLQKTNILKNSVFKAGCRNIIKKV